MNFPAILSLCFPPAVSGHISRKARRVREEMPEKNGHIRSARFMQRNMKRGVRDPERGSATDSQRIGRSAAAPRRRQSPARACVFAPRDGQRVAGLLSVSRGLHPEECHLVAAVSPSSSVQESAFFSALPSVQPRRRSRGSSLLTRRQCRRSRKKRHAAGLAQREKRLAQAVSAIRCWWFRRASDSSFRIVVEQHAPLAGPGFRNRRRPVNGYSFMLSSMPGRGPSAAGPRGVARSPTIRPPWREVDQAQFMRQHILTDYFFYLFLFGYLCRVFSRLQRRPEPLKRIADDDIKKERTTVDPECAGQISEGTAIKRLLSCMSGCGRRQSCFFAIR